MITLNFTIDDNYLIWHVLTSMEDTRFSSTKYKQDIVNFQNYAWDENEGLYNFLIGRIHPSNLAGAKLNENIEKIPGYLRTLKQSQQYEKLLQQTKDYLHQCQTQWDKNYDTTHRKIEDITKIELDEKFTVYITHPSLKNGSNIKGDISWGHNEEWPNYTTVYIWHEILHSYFGSSDVEHAIIELVTDEELRTHLNGGEYPPFEGHSHLEPVKQKLLDFWQEYLRSDDKDIHAFVKTAKKQYSSENSTK